MINLDINGEIIKDIKVAIFDRDGTLIDLYTYWAWMIRKRAEFICQKLGLGQQDQEGLMFVMGIDLQHKKIRTKGPVGLKKREIVMQAVIDYLSSAGHRDALNLCTDAFRKVDELSMSNLDEIIKPICGLYDVFTQLEAYGCMIALATTDKTRRAKVVMDFLGLSKQLDIIVGEDMVDNPKPAPDMINLILDHLDIDKADAVMVGDAAADIEMGMNAGLKASIGVCSGLAVKKDLYKITPYVVEDISKIKVKK